MKNVLLIISIIIFFSCYYKPKTIDGDLGRQCRAFKTGKFTLTDSAVGVASAIIRNDTLQIEKVNSSIGRKVNGEYRMRVEWINDCTYKLIPIYRKGELIAHYDYLIVEIDSIIGDKQYYRAYPNGKRLESQTFYMTRIGDVE